MIMPTETAPEAKPLSKVQIEKKLEQIAKLSSEVKALTAEQNNAVTLARAETQGRIDRASERIKGHEADVEDWARATRGESFGAKKSLEFAHAKIGFRSGAPKFSFRQGWTEDGVMAAIRNIPKFAKQFLRKKEELNRNAIKDAAPNLAPGELENIGVEIETSEKFFITPRLPD